MGSKGQNLTFSKHGHVAYQIKGKHECSSMVADILPADPYHPLTLGLGSIGQNSTFSEHGHVAYQIKWIHEMKRHGSKYFAHRPPDPRGKNPLTLGVIRSKVKICITMSRCLSN